MGGITKENASDLGQRGGNKTKERLKNDPEYYERNGMKGYLKLKEKIDTPEMKAKWGPDYFSAIGSLPKKSKKTTDESGVMNNDTN